MTSISSLRRFIRNVENAATRIIVTMTVTMTVTMIVMTIVTTIAMTTVTTIAMTTVMTIVMMTVMTIMIAVIHVENQIVSMMLGTKQYMMLDTLVAVQMTKLMLEPKLLGRLEPLLKS